MPVDTDRSARLRRILLPAFGLGVLAFVRLRGTWPTWVRLHRWLAAHGVPDAVRNLDATLLMLAAPLLAALLVTRGRLRDALNMLGLAGPVGRASAAALLFAFPMFLACALGGTGPRLSLGLIPGVVVAPFVEEFFFRGLLCALLVRAGGWRFWPAAVFGGLLFGSAHVSWTAPPTAGSLPVFLVTGAGGVWFAWLLYRWRWNLWVPIHLHALMNLSWMLFGVAENAVGGLLPNVGRGLTIALSIVVTLRPTRFGFPRESTAPRLPPAGPPNAA